MAQAINTERDRGSSQPPRGALMGEGQGAVIPDEFKGLKRFQEKNKIEIIRGGGPGFAEVFFEGEITSPDPSKNIVQVRETGEFDPNKVAAADMLHFLGGEKRNGQPFDKEFFKLKQEFIADLSPNEVAFAREKFDEAVSEGATGENFESFDNFMQSVWGDALIRGGLFPELMTDPRERKEFRNRSMFTKDQSKILDKMNRVIRRK